MLEKFFVSVLQGKPAKWRDFHSATAVGTNMYIFGGRGKIVFSVQCTVNN